MVRTVVLLPGLDGTGEMFTPLVGALGPDIRSIVVRYPDAPLDYAGYQAIARAALPAQEPYILLGESFSGPIAERSRLRTRASARGLDNQLT